MFGSLGSRRKCPPLTDSYHRQSWVYVLNALCRGRRVCASGAGHCPRVADTPRLCGAQSTRLRRPCPVWHRRWACSDTKTGPFSACKDDSDLPTCGQSLCHQDVPRAGPGGPVHFLPSSASSRHAPGAMSKCPPSNCHLPKLTGVGARPFIPRLRHLGGQAQARPIKFKMDSTRATHFEKTGCPRHPRSGPPYATYKSSAPWAAGPFLRVPGGQSTSWDDGYNNGGYIGPASISNCCHVSTTVRESRTLAPPRLNATPRGQPP